MSSLPEREAAVLWPTYVRPRVEFVRGRGVHLWDARGREYLDFLGGIAVVAAGHAHPRVVEAVSAQLGTLGHTSNLYFTGPQVELAERLVGHFGGDAKVFLSNSGAEANEAAIKVARRWAKANRGEQASGIVATLGGFHGRTLATLAATGKPAMHTPFQPLPPGFSHVPFGDADALAAAIGPDTAAVMVEPIQGEAGIRVPPAGYLRAVRELTSRAGVLLIVDEIQSGMGRTGRFFAYQRDEVRPDVVTMAKALGSGYPIGATIARTEVADAMQPGDHGTTFGGNPVACAAALATLEVIEPLLEGHVDKVSARLADGLQELRGRLTGRSTWAPPSADDLDEGLPGAEVRGAGLWFALDLGPEAPARFSGAPHRKSSSTDRGTPSGEPPDPPGAPLGVPRTPPAGPLRPDPSVAKQAALAALGRGLVVNPVTDTALRLAPPLVVSEDEIDEGLARLGAALEEAGLCR